MVHLTRIFESYGSNYPKEFLKASNVSLPLKLEDHHLKSIFLALQSQHGILFETGGRVGRGQQLQEVPEVGQWLYARQ